MVRLHLMTICRQTRRSHTKKTCCILWLISRSLSTFAGSWVCIVIQGFLYSSSWYIYAGIPFNNTNPYNLDIATRGQVILGDKLLGLQAGATSPIFMDNSVNGHQYVSFHSYLQSTNAFAVRTTLRSTTLGTSVLWWFR
jgi:hypothetical protein